MSRRRTKLIRVYEDDLDNVRTRFPDVKMPYFFHVSVKTNPFLQAEALLRGKKGSKK